MNIIESNNKDDKFLYENEEHDEKIFLDYLAIHETPIQIFLIGGIRLNGNLIGSDEYSIIISTEKNGTQMIYKHSIATICINFK